MVPSSGFSAFPTSFPAQYLFLQFCSSHFNIYFFKLGRNTYVINMMQKYDLGAKTTIILFLSLPFISYLVSAILFDVFVCFSSDMSSDKYRADIIPFFFSLSLLCDVVMRICQCLRLIIIMSYSWENHSIRLPEICDKISFNITKINNNNNKKMDAAAAISK